MSEYFLSLATALPEHRYSQSEIFSCIGNAFQDDPLARKMFSHPGIQNRSFVLSREDLASYRDGTWGTAKRNGIYAREAPRIGARAVRGCLDACGIEASAIDHFIVVTCTGCITPGLDILLAREFGMRMDLRRTHIGGMGCYAVFPAIRCARDSLAGSSRLAMVLAVELCSLHLQPTATADNIVSASLFSDGAAAVLLGKTDGALHPQIRDALSWTDYSTSSEMTWKLGDTGFCMSLSSYVPQLIGSHIREFVMTLLGLHGLHADDVHFWIVHPGGPKILDQVQQSLGLSDRQMDASREVLRDCGNMSSATVLFILESLKRRQRPNRGDWGVMLGFGPGLTMEACLIAW